jgi:hypothetical protein
MKRHLKKNFDYGEPFWLCRGSLYIHPNPDGLSDEDFKCIKNRLKRTRFNGGFRIYLPDHPVPQ